MLTIGLTGGIGSGKTTVSKFLEELGASILDADKVGHAIYQPKGPAYREVVAAFGPKILAPDGSVDRAKLGPIVFADAAARRELEAIVHPAVYRAIAAGLRAFDKLGGSALAVVEIPLLYET